MSYHRSYDFRHLANDKLELIIEFQFCPTKVDVINSLKHIINNFKAGSIYNEFAPKLCIVYPYIYGWKTGFNACLTIDVDNEHLTKPYFDEPTGKHSKKGRKSFFLNLKNL